MKAIDYLRGKEWSMGNGQCPECCGVPPDWHGHIVHLTGDTIGHEKKCPLASVLRDLGEVPVMIGGYKSDVVYETYWTESGFLSTRALVGGG